MNNEQVKIHQLKYDYLKLMIEKAEKIYEVAEKSQKQVILTFDKRDVFYRTINSFKAFFSTLNNQYTLERFAKEKLNSSYNTIRRLCLEKTSPNFRKETILNLINVFYELLEELEEINSEEQSLEVAHAWYN